MYHSQLTLTNKPGTECKTVTSGRYYQHQALCRASHEELSHLCSVLTMQCITLERSAQCS